MEAQQPQIPVAVAVGAEADQLAEAAAPAAAE
jgi:hypothetical protein